VKDGARPLVRTDGATVELAKRRGPPLDSESTLPSTPRTKATDLVPPRPVGDCITSGGSCSRSMLSIDGTREDESMEEKWEVRPGGSESGTGPDECKEDSELKWETGGRSTSGLPVGVGSSVAGSLK
jgi:hypothetical protein